MTLLFDGTGYAVLDCKNKTPKLAEKGTVSGRTASWSGNTTQDKLAMISAKARELRAKYNPLFPIIFMERGFTKFNNSTQATFRARGALESELVGLEIVEFTPTQVKKIITGNGSADKSVVAKDVAKILGVDPSIFVTEDESDATAVAYVGYLKHYK